MRLPKGTDHLISEKGVNYYQLFAENLSSLDSLLNNSGFFDRATYPNLYQSQLMSITNKKSDWEVFISFDNII